MVGLVALLVVKWEPIGRNVDGDAEEVSLARA